MDQVLLYCSTKSSGDWTIRVDQPHGSKHYHRKHVHVAKKGLAGEYSWNIDGTRHDKKNFPVSEKCISAAKQHAASALRIPISSLQFITAESGGTRMSLRSNLDPTISNFPLFTAYVPVKRYLAVFGSPSGLVLVLANEA